MLVRFWKGAGGRAKKRKKETERREKNRGKEKEFLAERSHLFEGTRNTLAFS